MSETVRVGMIGCGEHARENLLPAIWDLKDVHLTAVCDEEAEIARSIAKRFPNCAVEPSFNALLRRSDLDAVVIAATPEVHFAAGKLAMDNGIHTFVEKPPTSSRAELEVLVRAASDGNLVTGVGHNLRHSTAALEMQRMLSSPQFGRPVAMEMRYFASKPKGDRWGLNSPLRSFLLSHANHAIDFMIYQLGPIHEVSAAVAASDEVDISLTAQFVFRSGAVGTLLATSAAPHFSIAGSIVTECGRVIQLSSLDELVCFGVEDDAKRWGRCWTSKTIQSGYAAPGYSTELRSFINAVVANEPVEFQPSFADELEVYDAIDEIERRICSTRAARTPLTESAAVQRTPDFEAE